MNILLEMVHIEGLAVRIEPVQLSGHGIYSKGVGSAAGVGNGELSDVAAVHLGCENGLCMDVRPVDIAGSRKKFRLKTMTFFDYIA